MKDMIDRQTAIDLWETYHPTIAVDAMAYDKALRELPSAQIEWKKGRWVETTEDWRHQIVWWKCSECGMDVSTQYNYCPDCGADMRGEQNATD